jgi:hypothetical protein
MRQGDAAIRPGLDDQPLPFIPRLDHPGHGDESFPQGIEGQDLWGNPSLSGQFVESGFQLRGKCDHHLDLSENDRPRGKEGEPLVYQKIARERQVRQAAGWEYDP